MQKKTRMNKVVLLFLIFSVVSAYSQSNVKDKNIYSLIGKELFKLENQIFFEEYTVRQGGGYIVQKGNFDADFGIIFYNSTEKIFLLFNKKEGKSGWKILDILELDKKEVHGKKLTEYCSTKKVAM